MKILIGKPAEGKKSTCDLILHLKRLGSMSKLLGMLCQHLRKQAVFGGQLVALVKSEGSCVR